MSSKNDSIASTSVISGRSAISNACCNSCASSAIWRLGAKVTLISRDVANVVDAGHERQSRAEALGHPDIAFDEHQNRGGLDFLSQRAKGRRLPEAVVEQRLHMRVKEADARRGLGGGAARKKKCQ